MLAVNIRNMAGIGVTVAQDAIDALRASIREETLDSSSPAYNATGGVYINFITADESDRVHAAYGANYGRLVAIKNKYDPANMFRMNHNIQPPAVG